MEAEGEEKIWHILRNEKVGRYVVAGRNLEPGDIIFSELPFVYGPKADTPPLCLGCYCPSNGSVLCSKCGWPVCGPECENIPAHKDAECKVFSDAGVRFQPVEDYTCACPQYECITHLRMLIAKENNPEKWEAEVKTMESHNELRKEEPIWDINKVNIVEYLLGPCKLQDRCNEDLLHTICGIIEINAFEGRNATGHPIRLIYPKLAMMSHNCISNTSHSIVPKSKNGEDYRMYLRANVKVQKDEELFATYTHSLEPTMLRRDHLKEGKYFDCTCARCTDPTELGTHMSTLKCTKCDNGIVLSTNPLDVEASWKCNLCEFIARGEAIRRILYIIQSEIDMIEATERGSTGIEEREKLFRKFRSVLHPRHSFMTMIRHSLSQMYGRMEEYMLDDLPDLLLERKVELCQALLDNINVVEPGYSRLRGMTLYELHAPLMLLARNLKRTGAIDKNGLKMKLEEVLKILEEAATILKLEPESSPEGIIGQVAEQSLQQLKENIHLLIENEES